MTVLHHRTDVETEYKSGKPSDGGTKDLAEFKSAVKYRSGTGKHGGYKVKGQRLSYHSHQGC